MDVRARDTDEGRGLKKGKWSKGERRQHYSLEILSIFLYFSLLWIEFHRPSCCRWPFIFLFSDFESFVSFLKISNKWCNKKKKGIWFFFLAVFVCLTESFVVGDIVTANSITSSRFQILNKLTHGKMGNYFKETIKPEGVLLVISFRFLFFRLHHFFFQSNRSSFVNNSYYLTLTYSHAYR